MENGLYAKINTTKGVILAELFYELAPATVGNFVSLSKGILENSVKKIGQPYYNDLKFHRVISDFMIQGGCPLGTGTGNPGYQFDDEFHPDLKHDRAGYYCHPKTQLLAFPDFQTLLELIVSQSHQLHR